MFKLQKRTVKLQQEAVEALRAGDGAAAGLLLDKALEEDDGDAQTLALRSMAFSLCEDRLQALGHALMAHMAAPQEPAYKQNFLAQAADIALGAKNEAIEAAFIACLDDPAVDCTIGWKLWLRMLALDGGFDRLCRVTEAEGLRVFDSAAFDKEADLTPLLSPLFTKGLWRMVAYDPVFEAFLTALRARLLREGGGNEELLAGLAQYCFETEYIFALEAEEEKAARALKEKLESDAAAQADGALVALCACYYPLYALASAEALETLHQGPAGALVQAQVTGWRALRVRAEKMPALTEISAGVSEKVRAQYEVFPYPRVTSFTREITDNRAMENAFVGKKARILVAGCGTGREALELASMIPDATVLAIDLSRASLAYAEKRAEECGVKNVTFRQADILKLAALEERFDLISSGGVLHHMEDPLAGWRVLCGLLKPEGMMRIGLYSELGRGSVVAAREVIAREGFDDTLEGMRAFRQKAAGLLSHQDWSTLAACPDYYHAARLRDYLFHVQEHRFTFLQVAEALKALGLEIYRFNMAETVIEAYRRRFPEDVSACDLAKWDIFEKENPATFAGMYQFFCRKTR